MEKKITNIIYLIDLPNTNKSGDMLFINPGQYFDVTLVVQLLNCDKVATLFESHQIKR